ncbi:hypothetical protein SDC9_20927 [bioreactor metagenome]|uniref:PrcB C-terminal domain-containing protein n=1 Tax=bioreactor metagenome TaxID=1076179 RepID=A0A644U826_9ZZZZ|nr:hypothetical protein [Negativicutes bacterium]
MKHNNRPKSFRKKYKRIVAAVAGAAVISSAMLPGLPLAKVQAQETQKTDQPANSKTEDLKTGQSPLNAARQYAKDHGYDTSRSNLSLQWSSNTDASVLLRQDDGNTKRIKLLKDHDKWQVKSLDKVDKTAHNLRDPVDVVKDNAASFGFDARTDRFTLLSLAGPKAIVQVRHNGQTFKVDLIKKGAGWDITTIRGIGDMNHSATYTPASFFPYKTAGTLSPAQAILYRTNTYESWKWNETTYPNDITFGVILQNPELASTSIPGDIRNKVANVNYNNQFVVFAYLGNVAPRGYGIGIEKITQSGNAITVTVHTKSPNNTTDLPQTKYSDTMTIDRAALRNESQVHITFIDQNGRTLSNYTIATR